jgi:hypothetical protein
MFFKFFDQMNQKFDSFDPSHIITVTNVYSYYDIDWTGYIVGNTAIFAHAFFRVIAAEFGIHRTCYHGGIQCFKFGSFL